MEPTDIELMLRVREGDMEAFRQIVERYREPLKRFFAAIAADRSQSDDFVQETFLRLWLHRQRYEPTGRFSTYLFQIGKHYWLNQRKKVRVEVFAAETDGSFEIETPPAAQPENVVLERLQQARIRRAIAELPEHYRIVFELSHFEGLTYAEIACRLDIPVGTVKSRMFEAVRRLRNTLSTPEERG